LAYFSASADCASGTVTQRNGQRAGERGEGRHHDRPEAQQAGFVNGSLGILALGPLRLKREIDHHDRVLLHDTHQDKEDGN